VFGNGESVPDQPIELNYTRPLNHNRPLEIVAHRGGGSTADLLPASENSVEIIRLASRYGATGVEIDVRLTKDGVPILFHDATLSERLIQKNGLLGPISNFTYSQLTTLVRLINGERIPTLRQALDVVLYQTPLRFVWLDTKFEGSIQFLRDIQQEYIQKAVAAGRDLQIVIGLPDEEAVNQFLALPGYPSIPSVCELTPEDVIRTNAAIWAPRWTLGLQKDETARMEALGKRVFVWTLDVPANVKQFLNEGNFDGILSNYPSIVAYYYYVTE
jgi:glycerophosphoryl diester phosphodiesterase